MGLELFPPSAGGIPTGSTADRPANPVIGDVYYNGTDAILEIYTGNEWLPASAPPSVPTISVANVGTNVAYGAAQAAVTFTPGTVGGKILGFTATSATGNYFATSSSSVVVVTTGNNGSYTFSGTAFNDFGTSPSSPSSSATLTTLAQAPTIGSAGAGNQQATVTFTANNDGGSAVTSFTVTSSPDNITATGATSPITVTGLTNGTSYTFTVQAENANGFSLPSAASNSVTPDDQVTVNYLVLAGGGGNTGGAGGLRSTIDASGRGTSPESSLVVDLSTNYTVTVGSGGTAGGSAGGNSVFSTITSLGGGQAGVGGGCGGGGNNGAPPAAAPAGTAGQGFDGGQGANTSGQGIGGSGGGTGSAGGVGKSGTGNTGNPGGNGTSVSITGSAVVYGGGGGPGGNFQFQSNTGGAGGTGGGGNGAAFGGANVAGQNGETNLGGGGGGNGWGQQSQPGGAGGSGVVILRYPSSFTLTVGAGLTSSTNIVGVNKVTSFTAGSGNVSWS